jgi:Methyltransferase domain
MDLTLPRRVEPEILDDLAASDPRAVRSRADLRRMHRVMATLPILAHGLRRGAAGFRPRTVLELGAGDGSMMLRLARRLGGPWPDVQVTLLDRLDIVTPQTRQQLCAAGWTPEVIAMDVFDWLAPPADARWDIVMANLFVHHFAGDDLARLLAGIAARARIFLCCEPRRTRLPLAASHLIGLLGAGPVTRQDAVLSVRGGFRARELSLQWPDTERWVLREYSAGLFSHCLLAMRKES